MDKREETKDSEGQLPEAPASVNVRLRSPRGFEYQWTIRDASNKNLLYKVQVMEQKWLNLGWEPLAQNPYANKPKQQEQPQYLGVCTKCGAPNKLSAKGKIYCSEKCWL